MRLARGVAPPAVHAARPQTLAPPFPYEAEAVAFIGADGSRLSGTLTRPPGPGPHRVIVLSTWQGQVDRDQTVAGHKPFALWADHLTRRGFATLRYDKRGTGISEGRFDTASTGDFAADLACAVAFLRTPPDLGAVGLLGHSEGGHISADVAAADPAIAFCVMMTPAGLPDDDILETHMFAAARAVGGAPRDLQRAVRIVRALGRRQRRPPRRRPWRGPAPSSPLRPFRLSIWRCALLSPPRRGSVTGPPMTTPPACAA
uniref:Alpha/beta hydrolase n=1 Tax=Phenylobacterium glaciei TaxID=2803784 RepID=A0A974S8M9_9CAUL|nr:alpha/beta hydrolase [Phenylobacterium glaciei]